jgi:hypothetical protein
MDTLIDAYFTQINPLIFLLHAPTFRRAVAGGLHLHNERFGQIVLAVCALGAKYSNDSRVFLDDVHSEHTAGWKWFRQIPTFPTSFITTPSLHDLQLLCVGLRPSARSHLSDHSLFTATLSLHHELLNFARELGHDRLRFVPFTAELTIEPATSN